MGFFEKRREKRYEEHVPVRILSRRITVKVAGLELMSADVSLHGLQLVCPETRFMRVKKQINDGLLIAEIQVPGGASVSATCAVAYISTYGDEVLIGLRIETIDSTGGSVWAAYIDELDHQSAD